MIKVIIKNICLKIKPLAVGETFLVFVGISIVVEVDETVN